MFVRLPCGRDKKTGVTGFFAFVSVSYWQGGPDKLAIHSLTNATPSV
jgi:hypothetical protein